MGANVKNIKNQTFEGRIGRCRIKQGWRNRNMPMYCFFSQDLSLKQRGIPKI